MKGGDLMIRPLKDNGGCGSKLITFPKEVLSLAGFENVDTVIVEVKKGEIILRKEKEYVIYYFTPKK